MAGMTVRMLLILAYDPASDPVRLVQVAIVAQAVVTQKSLINLFNYEIVAGRLSIHREPYEIGATGGHTGAPVQFVSQRLGQQPAVARFEDDIGHAHVIPCLV